MAAAALASPWAREQEILLIARDHGEREVLAAAHPGASIVAASDPGPVVPPGHRSVRIMCCAVGLIHPVRPDPAMHMDAAARDLRVLDRILERCGEASVHVLFVSSVLTLAALCGRRYYAGWKSVTGAVLASIVERHPRACLSVVYPGRLVDVATVRAPVSLLHTSYRRLAATIIRMIQSPSPGSAIVGADARFWLLVQGLGALRPALTGRAGRAKLEGDTSCP